jgi:hypothetical protein
MEKTLSEEALEHSEIMTRPSIKAVYNDIYESKICTFVYIVVLLYAIAVLVYKFINSDNKSGIMLIRQVVLLDIRYHTQCDFPCRCYRENSANGDM